MCDLHRIRQYLIQEVPVLATNALVSNRMDYCSYLFTGLSCFNQHTLQSIESTIAGTVTKYRKYFHVIPILMGLTGCLSIGAACLNPQQC